MIAILWRYLQYHYYYKNQCYIAFSLYGTSQMTKRFRTHAHAHENSYRRCAYCCTLHSTTSRVSYIFFSFFFRFFTHSSYSYVFNVSLHFFFSCCLFVNISMFDSIYFVLVISFSCLYFIWFWWMALNRNV